MFHAIYEIVETHPSVVFLDDFWTMESTQLFDQESLLSAVTTFGFAGSVRLVVGLYGQHMYDLLVRTERIGWNRLRSIS
jgi:hypothetical protein